MRKIFTIVLSLLTISHYSISAQTNPFVQEIIDQVNIDTLYKYVSELSGNTQTIISGVPITIASRYKLQPSNDKAADYIKEKLESYSLPAYNQTSGSTLRNVYAVQIGTAYPTQKYIICAHYDAMPSGTLAPGADDNASGTAAVLEAARILSRYNTKYTIIYALWDEEEQGLVGSAYYANLASTAGENILGVINLDMIAYDSNSDSKIQIHTRASSLELSERMQEVNTTYEFNMPITIRNPGSTYSDHASFWNKSYKAILLIEDNNDFNAYYHTINDKIQYFNLPYYSSCTKLGIATLASFISVEGKLPVELIAFTVSAGEYTVILNWETATEMNNSGFEIQRSNAGNGNVNENIWLTIGFAAGSGNSQTNKHYQFIDRNPVSEMKSFYRLKQVDYNGEFEYSNVVEVELTPANFELSQNYPNPFNPSTKIRYAIPLLGGARGGLVTLKVYDVLGNEVATLLDEYKPAGSYEVEFQSAMSNRQLASEVYYYRLIVGEFFQTKKMILLR